MAAAEAIPSAAELKAMLGPAADEAGLNVICRVDDYDALLQAKLAKVRGLFAAAELAIPAAEVHTSPPAFFRCRTDFRVWSEKKGDRMFYAMTPKGERRPVEVALFPMGSRRINELMPELLKLVQPSELLRKKLFEARFLTTLKGPALITLLYHRPIDDAWYRPARPGSAPLSLRRSASGGVGGLCRKAEAAKLAESLGVSIVGRSKKRKLVVGEEYVTEELEVCGNQQPHQPRRMPGIRLQTAGWRPAQASGSATGRRRERSRNRTLRSARRC